MNQLEKNAQSFEKDYEYYQISSLCDKKTCQVCKEMNGKIFRFKDRVAGENFPPFHDGCRCSFLIHVPDQQRWIDDYVEKQGGDKKISFIDKIKVNRLLKKYGR